MNTFEVDEYYTIEDVYGNTYETDAFKVSAGVIQK